MNEIIIPFSIGLTLFLFGLQLMRNSLESLASERLGHVLLSFTKTPLRGFATGIISTALLQSSSAITVLTIGFVNAGILSFTQSIGIILGTNIGTTVTTQLLTLKIEDFSIPLIISGAALFLVPDQKWSRIGLAIGGLGCIFLGMETMKWIAAPLKERGWISAMLEHTNHPIITGIIVGTLITAFIHSSSATIAMTMGFYATGILDLPFAIAMVFGSNLGTCFTGLIASINTNSGAKQVAIANIILNLAGIGLFAPFIPLICNLAPLLSNNPTVQIAHLQTLFNVVCSLAILPFTSLFAQLIIFLTSSRTSV